MAHFAELNDDNIVQRVIVVSNDECVDAEGNESEALGVAFCQNLLGGRWVQTSYNHSIRKQYAGTGYFYDEDADVFVCPQPYPSWVLDENHDWQPPTPMPTDGYWVWNEESQAWDERVIGE